MLQRACSYIRARRSRIINSKKPLASEVLTQHLRQRQQPHWTSFCMYRHCVVDDQFGLSFFNWRVDESNYRVLRTGCWPFLKYHCTKSFWIDLAVENTFFTWLKFINLGVPTAAYGIGLWCLVRFHEEVVVNGTSIKVYFLNKEDYHSRY